MKNKDKNQLLWLGVITLTVILSYMWCNPRVVKVPVRVPTVSVPPRPGMRRRQIRREPEFRRAPIRQYKPGFTQQMGLSLIHI